MVLFQNVVLAARAHWVLNAACAVVPPVFSTQIQLANVAKPSLSQTSRMRWMATWSPNHWCASSCASAPRPLALVKMGRVCCSIW